MKFEAKAPRATVTWLETSNWLQSAAFCDPVKTLPAIVTVPVRAAPALAEACRVTDPMPDPEPPVTVIQLALDVLVYAQPAGAATCTTTVPPPMAKIWLAGLML